MKRAARWLLTLLKLQAIQEFRYPVAFAFNLLSSALFMGLLAVTGKALGQDRSLAALLLGFMVMLSLQAPARALEDPSASQEEILLARWPLMGLLSGEALARGIWMMGQLSLVFLLLALPLRLEFEELLAFWRWAPLAWWIGLGPGLFLASATLLFKRTGALVNLLSLAVLGGAVIPIAAGKSVSVFPYLQLVALVRGSALNEPGIWFAATLWVLAGAISLLLALRVAVHRGLLGVR